MNAIAWIEGKWLEREEREKYINALDQLIKAMGKKAEKGQLSPAELDDLMQKLKLHEKVKRIHRSEVDLLYFCWEYFSELRNPGNGGNWEDFDIESPEHAAEFHKEICAHIDHVSNVEKNAQTATAAPRAHAKSSYLSRGNPLREIIFRKRKFIVIISETPDIAEGTIDWIGRQLKLNKKLREDYGELLSPKQKVNSADGGTDNRSEFITWTPDGVDSRRYHTRVYSASTNQAIRGLNWNGSRPDLIILDDLEGIHSNAGTPEQRYKLKTWFSSDVMPLGDAKGKRTAFIYMGTIVHQDSLLNSIINDDPSFKSKKYKAIIKEPDNMYLWEQCREIYNDKNLVKDERKKQSLAFYNEHKEEMDKGVEVLWKEGRSIWYLMTWKWSRGSKPFSTEYQNEPRDEESQIFFPDNFPKYHPSELEQPQYDYYSFWDVATGKNLKRTDYNAIVTIAKHRKSGAYYIVDTWAAKCKYSKALQQAVNIIDKYKPKKFGVETIGSSWDAERQLKEEVYNQLGFVSTTIVGVKSHSERNKNDRIATLEPLIERGFLLFTGKEALLNEQLEQFPGGTHDDLPDCLACVIELAGGVRKRIKTYRKKPVGL